LIFLQNEQKKTPSWKHGFQIASEALSLERPMDKKIILLFDLKILDKKIGRKS